MVQCVLAALLAAYNCFHLAITYAKLFFVKA